MLPLSRFSDLLRRSAFQQIVPTPVDLPRWLGAAVFVVAVSCLATPAIADTPTETVPSFRNDVVPVLSRFGCNAGGCHGKLAGQNGFKLSLRGYAPEADYASLVTDELGRRINRIEPEQSLLLRKATASLPHGGGRLFATDSTAYQTLQRWIAAGSPGLADEEPRVTAISATPETLTLTPGEEQPIQVLATFSDGQQRDVTWLSRFQSNDSAYATVSPDGRLTARRHGEVSIVVSFQGLVDTVVLTMPYPHQLDEQLFAARHNGIDDHVMAKLQSLRIPPAELCDDATFLRRVMLDLIGTLPTADEVVSFLADQAKDKRAQLVERLMERPEFVDYWSLLLGDLLQNRKERDHDVRGVKGVRALHAWIRQQVAENRPWDQLAREVLTASGPSDVNPAVGYYIVTVGEKQAHESEVADSVAQAFLGTRIGCAKCHNHPLEKYTQDDYYHFIAFFSQVALDRKSPTDGTTVLRQGTRKLLDLERRLQKELEELERLSSQDAEAASADAKQRDDKQRRVTQLRQEIEQQRLAPPVVNQPRTGQPLAPQGLDRQPIEIAAGTDPRVPLAAWMTAPENGAFSGAIINRLWKHFFAVGLVETVDDLRETNPPSNQPLYDALVAEFVASRYDLRQMMKQVVNSRTYQLASTTTPENASDTRFYSHYYAKRLPAEVLLDALAQVTGVPETFQGYPRGTQAKQLPGPQIDSYFLTTFGRSERVTACACERSDDVTLSQLLHLQNSEALLNKFRDPQGNLLRWVAAIERDEELLERLFLVTYNRLPTEAERSPLLAAFQTGDRAEIASDLLWALLNAKEFTFNH